MSRIWGASYPRGILLSKAGCPLPYLHELPGKGSFYQRAIYVHQVRGYFSSYAIDFGTATGYVIALRVGTDRARGAIVTSYDVNLPWPDDEMQWGYDLLDLLSEDVVYDYGKLSEPSLRGVLDERRLLSRGRPVEGLLCGYSGNSIPALNPRRKFAQAEVVLAEDSGRRACSVVDLTICSLEFSTYVKERVHQRLRSFDPYDEIAEEDVV